MNLKIHKQCGMGFTGFILIAAGLIFVAILGMKMIPPYVHEAQIASIFKTIASDPAMQTGTIKDIKESFSKRATINDINEISTDDLEINKDDGVLSISASYTVKIPVAGNVSLVIEFNPSSS